VDLVAAAGVAAVEVGVEAVLVEVSAAVAQEEAVLAVVGRAQRAVCALLLSLLPALFVSMQVHEK
jgi:hypothetical protein